MENQIIKIELKLKAKILKTIGCEWKDVRIVLFEENGIRVYHHDYGTETFIKYEQL